MERRTVEIKLRLTPSEMESLNERVQKSGLSREAYLRSLLHGTIPRELPPPDYYSMMEQLYRVGNNLNQIARKAHALGFIDAPKYDLAVAEYRQLVQDITAAVILPQTMGG